MSDKKQILKDKVKKFGGKMGEVAKKAAPMMPFFSAGKAVKGALDKSKKTK